MNWFLIIQIIRIMMGMRKGRRLCESQYRLDTIRNSQYKVTICIALIGMKLQNLKGK